MLRGDVQNDILKQVAKEEGVPTCQAEDVIKLTYWFIREVISSSDRDNLDFKSVRVPGWGIFYSPDYKKNKCKKMNEYRKLKESKDEKDRN